MKKIAFILFFLPFVLYAQTGSKEANALLDKAVAAIKNDAAVQMDYYYKVKDDDGTVVQQDEGVIKLDGDKYALIMGNMKVWCNGKVQWSYMKDIDEIYITDAKSDEAQNLSPLSVMEMYRAGYVSSLAQRGEFSVVTLTATKADAEISKVELHFAKGSSRLSAMFIYMTGQGSVEVRMKNYSAKCKFGKSQYECPVKQYPTAEVVDMR